MTRPTETKTLHFDLSHGDPEAAYTLHACLREYRLERHTAETLAEAKRSHRALAHAPAARVTHFVRDLTLPADMPLILMVTGPTLPGASAATLEHLSIHLPREARRRAVVAMRGQPAHPSQGKLHPKLEMFGFPDELSTDDDIVIDVHDWKTAMEAAVSLVNHHAELLNLDDDVAARVMSHIEYSSGISDLMISIYIQAEEHKRNPTNSNNWINPSQWLDIETLQPKKDEPRYAWSEETQKWVPGPMKSALRTTKNAVDLESTEERPGCWTYQAGQPSAGVPATDGDALRFSKLLGLDAGGWRLNNLTSGHGLDVGDLKYFHPQVTVPLKNFWLRWLSVYLEFLDIDGKVVVPDNWKPLGLASWDTPTLKYVDLLPAVATILAIPLPADYKELSFPMPENAASVRVKSGGLGRINGIAGVGAYEPDVCASGVIMTSVFNLGIPLIAMVAGALITGTALNYIAKAAAKELIVALRVFLAKGAASEQLKSNDKGMWLVLANALVAAAISASPAILGAWIAAKIGEGAAKKAIPIVGWIATAVSVAVDTALLIQTSVEVSQSPATFILKADRKMDIQVNLLPDKRHQNKWPSTATHYRVTALYSPGDLKNGSTGKSFPALYEDSTRDFPLSPTTQEGPIQVTMKDLPWGGRVQIVASFLSENNWLAGHWESAVVDARPTDPRASRPTLMLPPANITERLVPLDGSSFYSPKQELVFADGERRWSGRRFQITQGLPAIETALDAHLVTRELTTAFESAGFKLNSTARVVTTRKGGDGKGTGWLIVDQQTSFHVHLLTGGGRKLSVAPGNAATKRDLDSSNIGDNLGQCVGVTSSQETGMLGYGWQASGQGIPLEGGDKPFSGQMFTFQNISDGQRPQSALRFVKSGFAGKPCLVYDQFGPASGDGFNFIIDSRNGGYHLRKVRLNETGPFDPPANQSWGRFSQQIDSAVVHPSGYVIGVNRRNSKVEALPVLPSPSTDAHAPQANLYSGLGSRPGLIHEPVGIAATADGTLLILEDRSNDPPAEPRVQAFDYQVNPVFAFKRAGGGKSAEMPLRGEEAAVTYLDVAAESTGYIYILKYLGKGDKVEDYRLDIHSPDGEFVSQSVGVNAARLAVTLWRDMYTLNFNILKGSGRTEPTVGLWIPSTPAGEPA